MQSIALFPNPNLKRIMKLTALFLLGALLHVSARGISQQVNYRAKNEKIQNAFTAIEQQTGCVFFYRVQDLAKAVKVDVEINDASLSTALEKLLKNQPLQYRIEGKTVFITQKNNNTTPTTPEYNPESRLAPLIDVRGVVKDEAGKPAAGVAVRVQGTNKGTTTNNNGEFTLTGVDENAVLEFRSINLQPFEIKITSTNAGLLAITLKTKTSELGDVVVTSVNTGYQQIPKERATGSFAQVDNTLLNRRVSTNIIDRLEGVTSGLVFNRNFQTSESESAFSIRGRSTIKGNTDPLIVIDNFPYEGDISNLNPNDVENITILKDAAAASIWGARSGNGVVVITTKKGKYDQPARLNYNANVTIGNKPDVFYSPVISSADMIDLTKFLFDKGLYNTVLGNAYVAVNPAIEILQAQKSGNLSVIDAAGQLEALKQYDVRNDISRYYYQPSISQQYNINLSGGSNKQRYFFSAGYDHNRSNLVRNGYERITINAANTYRLLKDRAELTTSITFTSGRTANNNTGRPPAVGYTFARLADDNGQPLAIQADYRKSYTDTVGNGNLLDFTYRPLEELQLADNMSKTTDYRINTSLKYPLLHGLDMVLSYQYNGGTVALRNLQSRNTYTTRLLINQFSQVNSQTGVVTKPIPEGDILDRSDNGYYSHKGRGQLNYFRSWNGRHEINAIGGVEVMDYNSENNSGRLYGYDPQNGTQISVDYVNSYSRLPLGSKGQISDNTSQSFSTDRYLSYFTNVSYSFGNKYTLSASARKDASNLFGVRSNQKGVPLWSAGLAWSISREPFYKLSWLPELKLRLTNGYNGNVDKTVSAYTTAQNLGFINRYGASQIDIVNPPNPNLRWERVNILNAGIDFTVKNNLLSGSIEYYYKNGNDLFGTSPVAPSTGVIVFRGNNADLDTKGWDLTLNSHNLRGRLDWTTQLLFSYTSDKIVKFDAVPSSVSSYMSAGFTNPYVGRPYNSVYAYRWAGLDNAGNPQGYVNGQLSTDYAVLTKPETIDDLVYIGPGRPRYFGSLRNNFTFRKFTLSINLTWKLKYFIRLPSIQYSGLYATSGVITGHGDYARRWQRPGDENTTHVPALTYPVNSNRENFYKFSEALVEKGDHIRFQDIQLSYDLPVTPGGKLPFRNLRVYTYANNLGLLWKATKTNIDPDYVSGLNIMPQPFTIAAGLNVGF